MCIYYRDGQVKVVIIGRRRFCTLLAIPGRPSAQNNQSTKFSHLGLLRCPVFKKIEQFRFHVKIDFFVRVFQDSKHRDKLRHSSYFHKEEYWS